MIPTDDVKLREQIKDHLASYLAGQTELSEFHDWLIPATWHIDLAPESDKRIAYRVQLLLAEFSGGDRTEEELRSAFWDVLNRNSITVFVENSPAMVPPTAPPTSITQEVGNLPLPDLGGSQAFHGYYSEPPSAAVPCLLCGTARVPGEIHECQGQSATPTGDALSN